MSHTNIHMLEKCLLLSLCFLLHAQTEELSGLQQQFLSKEAEYGRRVARCAEGACCSISGLCGNVAEFCKDLPCPIEHSDSCDTLVGPQGYETVNVPRPQVGSVPYGVTLTTYKIPGSLALTFDDGPWIYTNQLLDLLTDLQVTATFFITGNNRGKGHIDDPSTVYPALLKRMHNAGHQFASHTWTHKGLDSLLFKEDSQNIELSLKTQQTEIMFNEMTFRNIFGWFPSYLRPPFLDCSEDCLRYLANRGYRVISTNLDTKDYIFDDPSTIAQAKTIYSDAVKAESANQSFIVLAHVQAQTVRNLTAFMITQARESGFKVMTVGECLGDPRENWYRNA